MTLTVPPDIRITVTLLPVKLVLVNVIVGPFARLGDTVKETFTFAAKVLALVRVRVVVLVEPMGFTNAAGLATILKLGTVTVMLRSVAWIRFGDPPLAFNIRLYTPPAFADVGETVTPTCVVPPAVSAGAVLLNETGSPAAIDALFRVKLPANALTLVRLMVAVPVFP